VTKGLGVVGAGTQPSSGVTYVMTFAPPLLSICDLLRWRNHMIPKSPLSPRQAEALGGILRGLSDKEIGAEMGCTPDTVKVHVKAVLYKFGARSRTEAAVMVMREAMRLPCPRCGYVDGGDNGTKAD
jgi:DNA-binding NarL/FixJ family response regulator